MTLKKGRARRARERSQRKAWKAMGRIYDDPRFFTVPIPYIVVSLDEYRIMQNKGNP